jgi:hypothetical protein
MSRLTAHAPETYQELVADGDQSRDDGVIRTLASFEGVDATRLQAERCSSILQGEPTVCRDCTSAEACCRSGFRCVCISTPHPLTSVV